MKVRSVDNCTRVYVRPACCREDAWREATFSQTDLDPAADLRVRHSDLSVTQSPRTAR